MTSDPIQIKIRCQTPVRNLSCPPKPQSGLQGHGWYLHLKNKNREPKFATWGYKIKRLFLNKIKIPNPSQNPPASSKVLNQDLIDMDVILTFKIQERDTKIRTWVY